MRIGVALPGNGALVDAGPVSAAGHVQALTSNMSEAKTAIEALAYKQDFAYMAQARALEEKMFFFNGRKRAMSAVMTLIGSKPSLLFNTHKNVMQPQDKHVELVLSIATEVDGAELTFMTKGASSPWYP